VVPRLTALPWLLAGDTLLSLYPLSGVRSILPDLPLSVSLSEGSAKRSALLGGGRRFALAVAGSFGIGAEFFLKGPLMSLWEAETWIVLLLTLGNGLSRKGDSVSLGRLDGIDAVDLIDGLCGKAGSGSGVGGSAA